jgi:hypothetical protein
MGADPSFQAGAAHVSAERHPAATHQEGVLMPISNDDLLSAAIATVVIIAAVCTIRLLRGLFLESRARLTAAEEEFRFDAEQGA